MIPAPTVRIISTGSEILQGLYADTNAQNLSTLLFDLGFQVIGHTAVDDHPERLRAILDSATRTTDLVIMTGGLGPTVDDVNRFVIAEVYERDLLRDAPSVERMMARFGRSGRHMPENNLVQADIPFGARVLQNEEGTAPGFFLPRDGERGGLMALPGPPREWRAVWRDHGEALLRAEFPALPSRVLHTLHIALTPESLVNQWVADLFHGDPQAEVTILAKMGTIRLRITGNGDAMEEARAVCERVTCEARRRIPADRLFAEGLADCSLAEGVVRDFTERGATLALAESCTGGMVSAAVTDVAGSSAVLLEGCVTYSNAAKQRTLGVREETLQEHGAVSAECAREMAEGARARAGATIAIAITGIAGPGGATEGKPVGTVWFGVATEEETVALGRRYPGGRDSVRHWSTNQALDLARRALLGFDLDTMKNERATQPGGGNSR